MSSGLSWISYYPTGIEANPYSSYDYEIYNETISFFNSNPSQLNNGIVTSLQYNETISFGSFDNIAIQLRGFFCPSETGTWTFNTNYYSTDSEGNFPDDFSILFVGPPNLPIVPNTTYTGLYNEPSSTLPVAYKTFLGDFGTSVVSLNLVAGNYYPILLYFNQLAGGSILSLSFSAPSNPTSYIYDFTNYIFTSAPSPPCFKIDTKILTDQGYKVIQDLRKGDLVKTFKDGFKSITLIGKREFYHSSSKERIKNQLYLCSKDFFPEILENLIITGSHSILVDSFINEKQKEKVIEVNGKIFITDNKYRLPSCADDRTTVVEESGTYTIYHLALENNDYYMNYGIYANGLLVESCSNRYLKELSKMELIE